MQVEANRPEVGTAGGTTKNGWVVGLVTANGRQGKQFKASKIRGFVTERLKARYGRRHLAG
jgi:hypothetical protein